MKQKILILIVVFVAVCGLLALGETCYQFAAERDHYRRNSEALATACEQYKTSDSLNAARVRSLELSLDEFQSYRAADAALIKSLRQQNRDLKSVNDIQAQTIIALSTRPRDTVVVVDSIPIAAKVVRCGDPWYDFEGIVTADSFTGHLQVRDSVIISESVEHERFLGFLWKTRKIKNRQVDVVPLNPHTTIDDIIYIVIED